MSTTVPPSLMPFGRGPRTALASNTPLAPPAVPRLMSLDVFRGLVILAMLVVNNLGDGETTGYFWKHADWPAMSQGYAWRAWWGYATDSLAWKDRLAHIPLERYQLEAKLGTKRVQLRRMPVNSPVFGLVLVNWSQMSWPGCES